MIGRANHNRVFGEPLLFQKIKQPSDALVNRFHATEIVVHIAIIAPADEIRAGWFCLTKRCIPRFVIRIPNLKLIFRHVGWGNKLGIEIRESPIESHVMIAYRLASSGVVVE